MQKSQGSDSELGLPVPEHENGATVSVPDLKYTRAETVARRLAVRFSLIWLSE